MEEKVSRIMIVDRSEVARSIIAHILQKEMQNVYIVTCGSAEEAMEYLQREKFDLVTTALLLPGLDGLDLCHNIRKSPKQHLTPVIIVSSDADKRLLREGFSAGVTDYFNKSLGYKKLVEFIKDVSQRHAGLVGTILYLEDSPTIAHQTIQLMQKHGLQITHLTSGEAALALLKERAPGIPGKNSDYDVIFTDFFLEGEITGGDLLYAVRTQLHYSRQELPVLVITVQDNQECQADVFHAGANDFITKPIIEEALIARLKSLLMIKHQYNVLQRYSRDMYQLVTTDALTGVKNKQYLLDNGQDFIKKHKQASVIILDIANLEHINQQYDDLMGDHVLHAVGNFLNQYFPEDKNLVARLGGKRYAVMVPHCDLPNGKTKARDLSDKLQALQPEGVGISVRTGVSVTKEGEKNKLISLLGEAEQDLEATSA